MWTETDLVRACARVTSDHAVGAQVLGEHTYAAVLSALRAWLISTFSRGRGGNLPTLARLTWQRQDRNQHDDNDDGPPVLRPVFVPSEVFLRTHLLHAAQGVARAGVVSAANLEPCDEYSAVKIAIKFSCSLNKDVVSSCMRHLVCQLGEAIRSGHPVALDLGIGVLTGQDRAVGFRFKSTYLVYRPAALVAVAQHAPRKTGHQRGENEGGGGGQELGVSGEPRGRGDQKGQAATLFGGDDAEAWTSRGAVDGSAEEPGWGSSQAAQESKPAARGPEAGRPDSTYHRPTCSPGRTNLPGPSTPRGRPQHVRSTDGAAAVESHPDPGRTRPGWGVRVPPPSPRARAVSPSSGGYGRDGQTAVGGLPHSPGRDGRAAGGSGSAPQAVSLRAEADGQGIDAMGDGMDGMPIARTIQLALRAPRLRPASPGPSIAGRGRVVCSEAGAVTAGRPRPISAPRGCISSPGDPKGARTAAFGVAGGLSRQLQAAQHGGISSGDGVGGGRVGPAIAAATSQPLDHSDGEPHLLPVYWHSDVGPANGAIAHSKSQPRSTSATGRAAGDQALRCAPASPRAGIGQRPAWGAGQGARQRASSGTGAASPRPVSAPRTRAPAPATTATVSTGAVANAAAIVAPVTVLGATEGHETAVASAGDQPSWCRSAWMTSGADVNQLWSPDSKITAAVRSRARANAGPTQQGAGVGGRPDAPRRGAGGPGSRHAPPSPGPLQRALPCEQRDDGHDDRAELRDTSRGPAVLEQAQRGLDGGGGARKPLFMSPQKRGLPQHQPQHERLSRPQPRRDTVQPRPHQAAPDKGTRAAGGVRPDPAGAEEERDQDRPVLVRQQQRDQSRKDGGGAGTWPASVVATVRTLSPGAHGPPHNLRYSSTPPREEAVSSVVTLAHAFPDDLRGDDRYRDALLERLDGRQLLAGLAGLDLEAYAASNAAASVQVSRDLACNVKAGLRRCEIQSNGGGGSTVCARSSAAGGSEDWASAGLSSASLGFTEGYPLPVFASTSMGGSDVMISGAGPAASFDNTDAPLTSSGALLSGLGGPRRFAEGDRANGDHDRCLSRVRDANSTGLGPGESHLSVQGWGPAPEADPEDEGMAIRDHDLPLPAWRLVTRRVAQGGGMDVGGSSRHDLEPGNPEVGGEHASGQRAEDLSRRRCSGVEEDPSEGGVGRECSSDEGDDSALVRQYAGAGCGEAPVEESEEW